MRFLIFLLFLSSCATRTIEIGRIKTTCGDIIIYLYDITPNHKKSFVELAKNKYWDDYTFNRVIPNFVAQAGCPDTPEGFTDTEYLLKPEFNSQLKHIYGAVGAGRDDNSDKNSARCQFYIVHNKKGLHRLDGDYTIFGHVIKGMDVVDKLVAVKRDSLDTPLQRLNFDVNIYKITKSELLQLYPTVKELLSK